MMFKVAKYVIYDILRSKVLLLYTLFLLLTTVALFWLQEDESKTLVSLLSVEMIVLPLVSIIFSTSYFYNAYEFMELLVSQPLKRTTILMAQYTGISISLVVGYLIGVGLPLILFNASSTAFSLLFSGVMLTLCFSSFAFLASVMTRDKARGIGVSLMFWFIMAVLYDAALMAVLYAMSDYPMEKTVIVLASFNPIDLARISVLLKMDVSALMGYTGALYKEFFGSVWGSLYSFVVLGVWVAMPLWLALRIFKRKNI